MPTRVRSTAHPTFAGPLFTFARRVRASSHPDAPRFDPDDFLAITWCRTDRPAGVYVFKHRVTGHVLCVDRKGTTYEYLPSPWSPDEPGRYRPYSSWHHAVAALELWRIDGSNDAGRAGPATTAGRPSGPPTAA